MSAFGSSVGGVGARPVQPNVTTTRTHTERERERHTPTFTQAGSIQPAQVFLYKPLPLRPLPVD